MAHLTVPDLWDAFLEAEGPLKLRVSSVENADRIKSALSTYKTRILKKDRDLAEVLGKFHFDFKTTSNGGKVILEIGMKRNKAKPRMDIEIINE